MKVKNLNNSSKKTKKIIKRVFAEMLSEKMELSKMTVSELCKRADISRGAFYSHYDDIYGVAEEYENELIDVFFASTQSLNSQNIMQFIDKIFEYIRKNDETYHLICKSNDFLFVSKKLMTIASNKLLELCLNDKRIKNHSHIKLEIEIFLEGLFCEYIRYCRGLSSTSIDDIYIYTKYWVNNFIQNRS